jgi:hypothetical protein
MKSSARRSARAIYQRAGPPTGRRRSWVPPREGQKLGRRRRTLQAAANWEQRRF